MSIMHKRKPIATTGTTPFAISDIVEQTNNGIKDIEDKRVDALDTINSASLTSLNNLNIKTNEGIEALSNASNALRQTQITNCLLEVPQKIKLELNDGVLTLKAGSKVIVPNGFEADGTTPKFDEVEILSDKSLAKGWNDTRFLFLQQSSSLNFEQVAHCHSGNTQPSETYQYQFWYDTANNLVKNTLDGGTTWKTGHSLPICKITTGDGAIASIDQVFNGFGYIGSTVFVDKGVKGLIPNGFNSDGTLNNIEFAIDNVLTRTMTYLVSDGYLFYNGGNNTIEIGAKAQLFTVYDTLPAPKSTYERCFVEKENKQYFHVAGANTWTKTSSYFIFGDASCSSGGKIDFVKPKQPVILTTKEEIDNTLNKQQITNCLLEVPNKINLQLSNGTVILKAGSKVIVPNGAGVFNEVVTTQDQSITYTWNPNGGRQCAVFVSSNGTLSTDYMVDIAACFSNSVTGSVTYYAVFDTANNKVKMHNDQQLSLPIAIITQGSDGVTKSIDQVFNGFGYIGSTVFVDKGVKGLIPNGRNADGTLNNIEFTTSTVLTQTRNIDGNGVLVLTSDLFSNYVVANYNYDENLVRASNNAILKMAVVGTWSADSSGIITSFQPKQPFRALDYNTPHIVETYVNGASWYRVYSDGWCEQGGRVKYGASLGAGKSWSSSIALLIPYSNVEYFIGLNYGYGEDTSASAGQEYRYSHKTLESFQAGLYNRNASTAIATSIELNWKTEGYIN